MVFILVAIPLVELIATVPLAIIGGLSPVPVAILGFPGNLATATGRGARLDVLARTGAGTLINIEIKSLNH